MKRQMYALVVVSLFALSFMSCSEDDVTSPDTSLNMQLSEAEKTDLIFLREEEKLARDVYLYAYDKHGLTIFNNISQSEQQHMDQVLTLLNTYDLPDPASPERGVFSDSTLQGLYDMLTAKADSSIVDALIVGATIEDLDIRDIESFKQRTTRTDLMAVYENLRCGSRNHMRAYYSQLLDNGSTYTPQFISQEEFDAIINSAREQCGAH